VKFAGPLWLASRSPRRRQMLEELGIQLKVRAPDIDDAVLRRGDVSPAWWVLALAFLKARWVADVLRQSRSAGTVLGADTVCVVDDQVLGQPRDANDARRMLRLLRNAEHQTITGLCFIELSTGSRYFLFDRAIVRVGNVTDDQIEQYIASGDWRGKAGAYNLSERIDAGWPIECMGDPATVMGLPMRKLRQFTIGD
jgi:septum formation protein